MTAAMTPPVAALVAAVLAISAVCLAVRAAAWWRRLAARRRGRLGADQTGALPRDTFGA